MIKNSLIALSISLIAMISACTQHKVTEYDYFSQKQLDVDTSKLEKASPELSALLSNANQGASSNNYSIASSYTSATGYPCKQVMIEKTARTSCFIGNQWYLYPKISN